MQQERKRITLDCLVVGFALFSMFFGAGNVVFPPYLGMQTGTAWFSGFVFYFVADIGLAMLTMFAILRGRGTDAARPGTGRRNRDADSAARSLPRFLPEGPFS